MFRIACFFLLGFLLVPPLGACGRATPNDPGYIDAVEVKLKCRELADQMLATMPDDAIQGFVAMPTSFVDQNNTSRSSPLGRLIGESLFYEFNQRGFPTREYRLTGNISVTGGRDDLALASNQLVPTAGQKWGALLVGTYSVDRDATFVNARLVRTSDGLVLRTGQLVLVNTPIIARMGKTDTPDAAAASSGKSQSLGVGAASGGGGRARSPYAGLYPPLDSPANQIGSGRVRIVQNR